MDAWRYVIYLLVFTFDISFVRYRCEHSKINSISPRAHVLFSIYNTTLFILTGKKNPMRAPVTFPTNVIAPITPELKPVVNQVYNFTFYEFSNLSYFNFYYYIILILFLGELSCRLWFSFCAGDRRSDFQCF